MNRLPTWLRLAPLYLLALAAPISLSVGSIAAGLCLAVALAVLAVERDPAVLPPRTVLWGLAFLVGTYALATAFAPAGFQRWDKLLEENWLKPLLVAVPVLAAGRPRHGRWILLVLLAATAVAALYACRQHVTGWDPIRGRTLVTEFGHIAVTGFVNHKLSFGGQLLVAILAAAAWTLAPGGRRARRLLPVQTGLVVLLGLSLVWTYARGPWLGVLAGLVVLAALLQGRRRLVGLMLLTLPVVVSLLQGDLRGHLLRAASAAANETRLNLWRSSLAGIADRPLLGWGPGNFSEMLAHHEVAGFYNSRSHAHNDLLMHGVNAGVLGALASLFLWGGIAVLLYLAWRRGGGWVPLAGAAVLAGLAVAGLFQVFHTDDEVELVLCLVLGLGLARGAGGPADDCQAPDRVRD
ncbi:MAG: O-antigen ligase family protein [bacterium]|nr:O-antigen ligase family protein [bacterium]